MVANADSVLEGGQGGPGAQGAAGGGVAQGRTGEGWEARLVLTVISKWFLTSKLGLEGSSMGQVGFFV